jgi:hypothetical protein
MVGTTTVKRAITGRIDTGIACRRGVWLAIVLFFSATLVSAQKSVAVSKLEPVPVGVTLPVQLGRSLEAGKVKAGTKIVVTTTQRVPVGEHLYLNRGAALDGEVVTSTAGDGTAAKPSVLTIRFSQLRYRKQVVPVAVRAIAMANFTDVDDTSIPVSGGGDRGRSVASWTTRQMGGDEIPRSGWIADVINDRTQTVGYANYFGVYSLPRTPPNGDGPALPRAMGVFSTTASGLYGFDAGVSLDSSGEMITLRGVGKKLLVRNGDDMLLEVVGAR